MKERIYTVSQVNNYIRLVLEDDVLLNPINIEGEVSNLKIHTSGHIYFSIKDEECSINAVMYKQYAKDFDKTIENGTKVICFGKITSYNKTGQNQIYVTKLKKEGAGNVFIDFQALKEKLKAEGYFDDVYKMEIPKNPEVIGVITSLTGAALQDILNVAKRRNKNTKIIIIPAIMQGKDAPNSIIDAISLANDYKNIDVLVLARGGGSYEDLWAFNDENVAKSIFFSSIPIVTGIGHQIDFTISDFVADFRAETPSSAIAFCLDEEILLKDKVYNLTRKIDNILNDKITQNKLKFELNLSRSSFTKVLNKVSNKKFLVEKNLDFIAKKIKNDILQNKYNLDININKLHNLSPTSVLKRGYSVISNEDGKVIKSVNEVKKDENIKITFLDGEKKAKIIE